jgi:DNA-directed RNA polymerase beta' subunit
MAKSKTAPNMAALTAEKGTAKAAPKKAATKKAAAKPVAATDLIVASSNEVENLTKPQALKLAPELIEAEGINDFKLGGVLQKIQEEKWWEGDDFESFKDYIETGLGLPYRKCMYLVNIYEKLVAAGIKWSDVKTIGWSKLRFIIDLIDKDNVAEWVKRADTMNSLEIQEYVKGLKTGKKSTDGDEENTTKISSMVFKVHPDQKEMIREALDKKKEETGTEYDAVALETIALGYIEGNTGKPKAVTKAAVKKFLAGMTSEAAAALVIEVHPSLGEDEDEDEAEEA